MYSDNNRKFVAVLNRTLDLPKLMNALAHCSAGLASLMSRTDLEMLNYIDGAGGTHPGISKYPWIILQARNSNQLRDLRAKAKLAGIGVTDFVHTMLGDSAEQQLEATRITPEAGFTYYAVCLFGDSSAVGPLTKKFSVFRPEAANASDSTESNHS
jgi:hypothetical protein